MIQYFYPPPKDRALTSTITPGQSVPGTNGNLQSFRTEASASDAVKCYISDTTQKRI